MSALPPTPKPTPQMPSEPTALLPSEPTAFLLSGDGRYADPWHPFAETSARLAALLERTGWSVAIDDDPERGLARLAEVEILPALLVVNIGLPRDGSPSPANHLSTRGLERFCSEGGAVLAIHASLTSLLDVPFWPELIGGRWVRGRSMHPDYDEAAVHIHPHPLTRDIADFTVRDERYCDLEVSPAVTVLASHRHDGRDQPLAWIHEHPRGPRVAVDALGHDAASYDSREHVHLLRRMADWLVARG